jgi:TetR/AcrR family transcriptional regulator, transcriptional repressor for nem operon
VRNPTLAGAAVSKRPEPSDTPTRILDVAERLVQTRGFDGFSYADVATELGVTPPSLHYHFRGKAELGEALIRRYRTRFVTALDAIDGDGSRAPEKLRSYVRIYADVLRRGRMCLCGMLAAGYETLPTPMREEVVRFLDDNEQWLVRVLEQGAGDGSLAFAGTAPVVAQSIVGALEGALLVARPYGDVERFERSAERLMTGLVEDASRVRLAQPRTL